VDVSSLGYSPASFRSLGYRPGRKKEADLAIDIHLITHNAAIIVGAAPKATPTTTPTRKYFSALCGFLFPIWFIT